MQENINNNHYAIKIYLKEDLIKINNENNENIIPIQLNPKDKINEYKINILFLQNEYFICLENKEENIIKNIIKNLTINKKYSIQFQEKQYKLNTKQLLIIIIDKFIQIIKKEFIIKGIEFKIETENEEILKIINNLYLLLGYENIKINNKKMNLNNIEEITEKEMEIIDEIINKNENLKSRKVIFVFYITYFHLEKKIKFHK